MCGSVETNTLLLLQYKQIRVGTTEDSEVHRGDSPTNRLIHDRIALLASSGDALSIKSLQTATSVLL